MDKIQNILTIQRQAWNKGHDNYGSEIDVLADAKYFLTYFKHLNPAQKSYLEKLEQIDELKFGKKLCSRAHKAVRHMIVTLK